MSTLEIVAHAAIVALLVGGIRRFRTPGGARSGNHAAGLALLLAIVLVIVTNGVTRPWIVAATSVLGALAGIAIAYRASMTSIPTIVAFQHGMGGAAVVVVSALELGYGLTASTLGKVSGLVGLALGAATFSASLVAAAKLANKMKQAPTSLRWQNAKLLALLLFIIVIPTQHWLGPNPLAYVIAVVIGACAFGAMFAKRIGGADMPVLISWLNASAGFAAAFCGVAIENQLLIAIGATVASSGTILTIMMCRAMNRSLRTIFLVSPTNTVHPVVVKAPLPSRVAPARNDVLDDIARLALEARSVVVVPGYGMALAHAQFEVVRLTNLLQTIGKTVSFAIHPVAGRMPGHMNVLLAEADVDYDKLLEIDDANRELATTDLVLVIGACDVVNPAALDVANTPLSGMPILNAHAARAIVVCNLDERPGYSGVENPLYRAPNTRLLLGDAQQSIKDIHEHLVATSRIVTA